MAVDQNKLKSKMNSEMKVLIADLNKKQRKAAAPEIKKMSDSIVRGGEELVSHIDLNDERILELQETIEVLKEQIALNTQRINTNATNIQQMN